MNVLESSCQTVATFLYELSLRSPTSKVVEIKEFTEPCRCSNWTFMAITCLSSLGGAFQSIYLEMNRSWMEASDAIYLAQMHV